MCHYCFNCCCHCYHFCRCIVSMHNICGLPVGTWRDRSGVLHQGVPYSQMRVVARAKWQLYHLKGVLERGGLKPHVVLAGDNSDMADAAEEEDLADAPPSHDKAMLGSSHMSFHPSNCAPIQLAFQLSIPCLTFPFILQSIHHMQNEKRRRCMLSFTSSRRK